MMWKLFPSLASRRHHRSSEPSLRQRRLLLELLEDRRVLAGIPPTIALDGGGQAGALDSSFSGDGKQTIEVAGVDAVWDVAVHGGKIIVVGSMNDDFAVARFDEYGLPDTTFSGDGIYTFDFNGTVNVGVARSVAIDVDGSIVVAGTADSDFAVFRLDPDDLSAPVFAELTSLGGAAIGRDMVIQDDGKIVVVGDVDDSSVLVRYNSDGSLDETFDNNGILEDPLESLEFAVESLESVIVQLVVQPDEQVVPMILAAGTVIDGFSNPSVLLLRVGLDGSFSLDNFENGSTGVVFSDLGSTDLLENIQGLVLQDGKIVVAGTASDLNDNNDLLLARYDGDGVLDPSFGSIGFVVTDHGLGDFGTDVAADTEGRLIVSGSTDMPGQDFLLARYEVDGELDETFGDGGIVTTAIGNADVGRALAIDSDKIIVAGTAATPSDDFAVARYLSTGSSSGLAADEGGDAVTITGSYTDDDGETEPTISIDWGDGQPPTVAVLDLGSSATSGTFTASYTYLDDNPTGTSVDVNTITATITDDQDNTASAATSATVSNIDPVATSISGPVQGVRWQELTYVVNISDAGTLDTHTGNWSVVGADFLVIGTGLTASFTPEESGTYTIFLTVTDDDLGTSNLVTLEVEVTDLLEQGSELLVGGTAGNDTFVFTATSTAGEFTLVLNGDNRGDFSPTVAVRVFGGDGADTITINGNDSENLFEVQADRLAFDGLPYYDNQVESREVNGGGAADTLNYSAFTTPVSVNLQLETATGLSRVILVENIIGGSGNDILIGDSGSNVISGGGGNDIIAGMGGSDTLHGQAGNDLLFGGLGVDFLHGNGQEDIVIGGTSSYLNDGTGDVAEVALTAILAEWQRNGHYAARIAHLSVGGGLNGTYVLNSSTVDDDGVMDELFGDGGRDWFLASPLDTVKNGTGSETVTPVS